jgi:hypothetical protein
VLTRPQLGLRRANPTIERTDTALSHGAAAHLHWRWASRVERITKPEVLDSARQEEIS